MPSRRAGAAARTVLIFIHRWMGVALCLLFFLWFASGIVMMYTDFPAVRPEDRLERSPALDAATIRLSPAEACAKVDGRSRTAPIRLNMFDGRPAYRFGAGRAERLIYADTGEEQRRASPAQIARAAAAWTSQPIAAARVEFVQNADQWTVQGPLRTLRPLLKYSWPDGEQVYVSGATAEVVQYTTRATRFLAYLGPIPHWLYFTPLRQRQLAWSRAVIWTSGAGTLAALIGLVIAAWTYVPRKGIPYRGLKRWHTILGLVFGVSAATWAFSGMLSMDPFGSPAERNPDIAASLRGRAPIGDYDARAALAALGGSEVKQLELSSFLGEPVYLATLARSETRAVPPIPIERLVAALRPAAVRILDTYDAYYLDRRRRRPLPVVLAERNGTRYYIDPKTAGVVASYSGRAWTTRWLYHGLHSLDFPWLYNHRPLWDIVVIGLLFGGAVLCVTSLILAWRVLRRKLSPASRSPQPVSAP
jgi:hypothetical protein